LISMARQRATSSIVAARAMIGLPIKSRMVAPIAALAALDVVEPITWNKRATVSLPRRHRTLSDSMAINAPTRQTQAGSGCFQRRPAWPNRPPEATPRLNRLLSLFDWAIAPLAIHQRAPRYRQTRRWRTCDEWHCNLRASLCERLAYPQHCDRDCRGRNWEQMTLIERAVSET
jgi:hypothetical protein